MKNRSQSRKVQEPRYLHPMESFGSVAGFGEAIRINLLSKRLKPLVPFPHKHDFYQILLVTRGYGTHDIDFERHSVSKGSLFIMQPAEVHTWDLSSDAEGFVIEFAPSILSFQDLHWEMLKAKLQNIPNAPRVSPKRLPELIHCAEGAYKEYVAQDDNCALVLLADLMKFLLLLERSLLAPILMADNSFDRYTEFSEILERNYQERHDVEFYAKAMKLSPKALTMRFQRAGLKSPREYIQARCLIEAKRLLVYSNYSISDIAVKLGFDDPNYFARFFKRLSGLSPGRFRKKS